ncbi:MAG TPA: acetaldehyde dehydrogenase (acetylating) [Candidatus Binatus sp.]|uniref:acetaldehyde dehydrogenase (acetylating) n=1 Tax=Candidatus Binatus sp. TaxID=2811406 RepID=UPI002B460591|nr:acetaldehyde dehydrogenase (acetylating) [Candidatus Binatus sp.]HKN12146.1 acetaldehyde dehydrogenase (acetylating) [Candidatus Binatus sp.]
MECNGKPSQRVRCAILGSGNIGTDLMVKLLRSEALELVAMAGIDPDSEGLARARTTGIKTYENGIDGLLSLAPLPEIVFDATSAHSHLKHAPRLREAGIIAIDLTPAAVGEYVVPSVNIGEWLGTDNLNLVTCGGQATIPIVAAVSRVAPVEYAEIVATIASASAGPGTRQNIDEFTQTTARGLERLGGARHGKAIIVLNPADPPIMMRDTIYVRFAPGASHEEITASIRRMVREMQQYVPGYRLRTEPLFDDDQVTVMLEVEGAGDFLPRYSGNLDIMTAAAVRVGEETARNLVGLKPDKQAAAERV